MNMMILSGNICADPILKTVKVNDVDTKVVNFTVAAEDRTGSQKHTKFIRVHAWRGLADNIAQYLKKGDKVTVCGPARLNTYTANNNTYTSISVRADSIEFPNKAKAAEEAPAEAQPENEFPF